MIFYFLFCFLLYFMYLIESLKLPSDGDFLELLLLACQEGLPEPRLLELLQRTGKNEGGWGG